MNVNYTTQPTTEGVNVNEVKKGLPFTVRVWGRGETFVNRFASLALAICYYNIMVNDTNATHARLSAYGKTSAEF